MFISIQIFFLALIMIAVTFFELLNEYFPWWYVFVTLLLLIPMAVGISIIVYYWAKDKRSTRGKILGSVIMSIISVCLWCIWKLVFFLAIYKRDTVYTGMGPAAEEENYHATPKKHYLFYTMAETVIIVAFLTYYTCVIN